MQVKYTSDQLRDLLSDVLGGQWSEGSNDDGHFYKVISLNGNACSIKVDIREFLAAEFGGYADSYVLHWSPYECRYTVTSR